MRLVVKYERHDCIDSEAMSLSTFGFINRIVFDILRLPSTWSSLSNDKTSWCCLSNVNGFNLTWIESRLCKVD